MRRPPFLFVEMLVLLSPAYPHLLTLNLFRTKLSLFFNERILILDEVCFQILLSLLYSRALSGCRESINCPIIGRKNGSVLNFVGFWISYISSSAGIEDFQEEVVIVWVSIALASDRLDHVVCPFNLPG